MWIFTPQLSLVNLLLLNYHCTSEGQDTYCCLPFLWCTVDYVKQLVTDWITVIYWLSSGADFSLRNLGFGEALPSHVATYRTDLGLPHRDYSVSVGSDPDTETDGIMSPEHAVRLWGRSNTKSGRSSCLSSRANSNLTLTDTEHENTENGRALFSSSPYQARMCSALYSLRLNDDYVGLGLFSFYNA